MNKFAFILMLFICNLTFCQVTKNDFENTIIEYGITPKEIETTTLYNVYPLGSGAGSTLIFNKAGGRMITFKESGLVLNVEPNHLQDNQITFIPYSSIEYFALNEIYLEIILKRVTPY